MQILIADDEAVSRLRLQRFLESWGHVVVPCADGTEAWQRFEPGNFPVVISDWMMPGLDGPELVRRIRAARRPGYVYVILLTARTDKNDVVAGMEAGADDFITKPFDLGELRARLRAGERILSLEHSLAEQDRQLREAQAALYQTEKLASLGQLAAGVAHEINNPLAYVMNNVAVLRRDVQAALEILDAHRSGAAADAARLEEEMDFAYLRENLPRLFESTTHGLQRVREIIQNLRDFARLDDSTFRETDLNEALLSTLEILRHEVRRKALHIEQQFGTLPPVACHPGKVNQVFLNVLVNAVQACQNGGRLAVRTRPEGKPPNRVLIEIADNGSGIPPEVLPHIFEPFFTTKPIGQGTGLGLSVSYGIIRDHGGSIQAESTPGQGTTFQIRLPIRTPAG